jgi:hypothetical protein
MRKGLAVGGAGAIGAGLLAHGLPAFAEEKGGDLTRGDVAILRFLAAPEPTVFLSRRFPAVSIIRPTGLAGVGGARATVKAFTDDGLFIGQSKEFFSFIQELAEQADEARREF